ncbi:hypothetical protein [Streptomyces decoyicus]|uniref:hypothetical protein n=1 Tax=Streptomyces decoyicus TaxID=249567 RepID=UPI00365725BD
MNIAAPRPHDDAVPALADLPGTREGLRLLEKAATLLQEARERPAALDEARSALQAALRVIPQSRPDGACCEFRERNPDMGRCLSATCGRCAPLRAASV